MNAWRPVCVLKHMTAPNRYRETQSVRRDAWRIQLFHEQIAEESAARRRAEKMRCAMWAGVALGVFGSLALYLV
jgi:hypothetical protein